MPELSRSMLRYEELPIAPDWEAYVVHAPPPPAPSEEAAVLRAFVSGLRMIAERRWQLTCEVFLQIWKIAVEGNAALYEDNLAIWQPSVGVGIWPHRKAPRRMTQASAMDHAADIMTGSEPELSSYHLCRVSGGDEAGRHAESQLIGRGMILEMYSPGGFSELQTAGRQVFLPGIADTVYRGFPFYLPVLDAATVAGAEAAQLARWTCGAELYLRESLEDHTLFILSHRPLREIMTRAAEMIDEAHGRQLRFGGAPLVADRP